MRHEERAFFRSRLTANTAREGRPSDEQADLTETQTPSASSSRWHTVPLTFSTLRFRMWGMALSGLLMRTYGYLLRAARRYRFASFTRAERSGSSFTAEFRAVSREAARATVGVPLR